jgi:hypothetical protein
MRVRMQVRTVWLVLTASALCACTGIQGGSEPVDGETTRTTVASDDRYCEAMAQLIVLLEPGRSSSPEETRAMFDEAARWFVQAREAAPESIASEVSAYADAYGEFIEYLDEVGYRLEAVFESPEGSDLAVQTSHTLTPAIVDYVRAECGLSFGDDS